MPTAIDFHVHVPNRPEVGRTQRQEQMRQYFGSEATPEDPDEFYQYYKDRDQLAVIFTVDGREDPAEASPNDWVAELATAHPDQFIGFGTVNPRHGAAAVREARRCVEELGLRGFKFHPITQRFEANDPAYFDLWTAIQEMGVPALFHTGQTGVGARQPGQGGIKNKYGRPYPYFDDLAADFPTLTVIMAHPSFPWIDEQLSVANIKRNVYIDLSGWSPKYFSANLIQYCNSLLQDKALYGSDFPVITPDRWLRDFATIPIRDEVRPKILLENAKKLLKLGS